jgi:hypothetical protein
LVKQARKKLRWGNAKSFRAQGNARSDIFLDAGSESQDIRKFLARGHTLSNSSADFFQALDAVADGFDGNGDEDHVFLISSGVHAQFAVDDGGAHVISVVDDVH